MSMGQFVSPSMPLLRGAANTLAGTVNLRGVSLESAGYATYFLEINGATATHRIKAQACSDATGTNAVDVGFRIRATNAAAAGGFDNFFRDIMVGNVNAGDIQNSAAATGYVTTANAAGQDRRYAIIVDKDRCTYAERTAGDGIQRQFVRVTITEVVAAAVVAVAWVSMRDLNHMPIEASI